MHLQFIDGRSFDLECFFNETEMEIFGKLDCYTSNVIVEVIDEVVESVNGNKTIREDVVGLVVANQICHYVPIYMEAIFPKLVMISISSSGLRFVNKYDLEVFPELIDVVFDDNELEYLDGDLFSLNTKIKRVYLMDNYLVVINGPLFTPIKLLTYLYIELSCMSKACLSIDCVPETIHEFKIRCEYDSIFPGFQDYFKFWLKTNEKCGGFSPSLK